MRSRASRFVGTLAISLGVLAACEPHDPEAASESASSTGALDLAVGERLDPPAEVGSFAPDLWADEEGLLMTWLEPLGDSREDGHRVRFARLEGDGWSTPTTVFQGTDLFANWADLPAVARTADGTLYAHWLGKTGADTYAYSIFLARSSDGGISWQLIGKLNDDSTDTEHGFVSWVREGDALRAFWLDGREMLDGGPMTLRTAVVGGEELIGASEVVDDRVCECCSTDATLTSGGSLVVYRDRDADEVRDVYRVGPSGSAFELAAPISVDGWRIEGCPVNGPEIASSGDRVFVSWFTAAGDRAQVKMARSVDGGATFGQALVIDDAQPLGRVDVVATTDGGAMLSWLGRRDKRGALYLQVVDPTGSLGSPQLVTETSVARASGVPRLAAVEGAAYLAWVETEEDGPSRLRVGRFALPASAG